MSPSTPAQTPSTADVDAITTVSERSRRLTWLPVAILLVGVLAQAVLIYSVNADTQAGSGYSMFSSVDFAGSRQVVVLAEHEDVVVNVQVPESLKASVTGLRREPTTSKAHDLVGALAPLRWQVDGETATEGGNVELQGLVVTVRGLSAHGRTLESVVLTTSAS